MELEKSPFDKHQDNWLRQASLMDNKTRWWKFEEELDLNIVLNYVLKIFSPYIGEISHFIAVKL